MEKKLKKVEKERKEENETMKKELDKINKKIKSSVKKDSEWKKKYPMEKMQNSSLKEKQLM